MFEPFLQEALLLLAIIAGVPLVVSAAASLIVGVLQSATQIQEQTVGHLIRFVVISAVIAFSWSYFSDLLTRFVQDSFNAVSVVGRSF